MGRKKKQQPSTSTSASTSTPPPQQQLLADDVDDADIADPVLGGIQFGINNVKKYINETLPKCSTDKRKKAMANKMEKLLLRLIKAEMVYTKSKSIVEDVVDKMPDESNADAESILRNCDGIADTSNRRINEYEEGLTEDDLKQHPVYIRLMADMERALAADCTAVERRRVSNDDDDEEEEEDDDDNEEEEEDDDDEEEVEEEDPDLEVQDEDPIPKTDPITKKPLTDPVRNKKCGHIYGKYSITQLIKQNTKLRCPIPGCSNKDFLRVSHLVNDRNLTAGVKKRTQAARKSKSRR